MAQTETFHISNAASTAHMGLPIGSIQLGADLVGVYNTNTNTSDWTINIYMSKQTGLGSLPDTSGNWNFECDFSSWTTVNGSVGVRNITVGLGDLPYREYYENNFLVYSFTISNVIHRDDGRLYNGCEIEVSPPSDSPYYDLDMSTPACSIRTVWASGSVLWYCDRYEVSSIAATNANIGSTSTISILKQTYAALSTVYYSLDGGVTTVRIGDEYTDVDKITWTVPDAFYARIPNAKQGNITFYVDTFDNEHNQIGNRHSTTIVAYAVEQDCCPTLSPTVTDTNSFTVGLTGNNGKLVKYKSLVDYAVNASARKYASISSIRVTNGTRTLTSATGSFGAVTDNKFTFLVTDSRGYTTKVMVAPEMVEYVNLGLIVEVEPPTADGYMSFVIRGGYFKGSFGAQSNTFECKYRLKEQNGDFSDWVTVDSDLNDTNHSKTISMTGMDYLSYYTLQVYVTDVFGRVDSGNILISTMPVFDWSVNDFNMNVPMTVYGKLTVNGDLEVTGEVNGTQGTGGGGGLHFGDCPTAGATDSKIVTCGTFTQLEVGQSIRVQFDFANTASSVTMNVNGTGAVTMKRTASNYNMAGAWQDGEIKDFVYDGSYWMLVDGGLGAANAAAISDDLAQTAITSLVMQSPNGTNFVITVSNSGELVVTQGQ